MDPQAAFDSLIEDLAAVGTVSRAQQDRLDDLCSWVDNGGFIPEAWTRGERVLLGLAIRRFGTVTINRRMHAWRRLCGPEAR